MRRPLIALSIALAAATAACTSVAPTWTYAPPTQAPASQPAASGDASAAPSAGASEAPASAAPSQDGGQGGGDTVAISAINVAFEQKEATAPADKAFSIAFDNKDAGIPHNVEIKDANGGVAFKGEIVTGPIQTTYNVGALAAGTYQFVCTVHPNMVGTLKVGG
jgi:plastocyanin